MCLLLSPNHTPDSHEPYHISLQPLYLCSYLSQHPCLFLIWPFLSNLFPSSSDAPLLQLYHPLLTSPTLCLSPCLPCPLLISLACMCVCVSSRPCYLPAFLLSSRYVCCTAPRRRLNWFSELPGLPVRLGPRICGLLWGQLSQVWALRACPGLCLPCAPRAGGTNLAAGLLGVYLCWLMGQWRCARIMEPRVGRTLSPTAWRMPIRQRDCGAGWGEKEITGKWTALQGECEEGRKRT